MFPSNNQQQANNDLLSYAIQQNLLSHLFNQQQNANAAAARLSAPNPYSSLLQQGFLQPQALQQQTAQPRASLSQPVNMQSLHSTQLSLSMTPNLNTLAQTLIGQQQPRNVEDMRRRPSLISGGSTGGYGLLDNGNGTGLTVDTRPTLNTPLDVRHSPMQPAIIDEELDRQKKEIKEKMEKVDKESKQAELHVQNLNRRRDLLQRIIAEKKESTVEENEESSDDSHETSFIDRIYAENRKRIANTRNSNPLLKNIKGHNPLPLYQEPSDLPELHKIREDYVNKMAPFLIRRMRDKREHNRQLIDEEHKKYNELYAGWQKKVDKWEKNPKKLTKDAKNREIYEKLFPEIKKSREEKERSIRSDRSRISMGGNLSMEKEDQKEEDKYKNAAVIPPIACVGPPRHSFDNNNGLVAGAFTEHKNRLEKFTFSWRDDEKKIFEDNIGNYGKNFAAIALFLKSRSVKDCVWYYYVSKKRNSYKTRFARRKKKIGKQYKPPIMPQLGEIFSDALQQNIVSKSSRVLICLLCEGKIETYILPPQIMTRSACDMYGFDVNDPNGVNEMPICQKCASSAQKHKAANRCPIGTCPAGKRKMKPVRTLPEKLNTLSPEHKRFMVHRLKIPPSATKCCNNCFKKISKEIENLHEGKLDNEIVEFIKRTAEKIAQYEEVVEWAAEEIRSLKMAIASHGTEDWKLVAEKINLARISAQHCQRQFEKMTADGLWSVDAKEETKENIQSIANGDRETILSHDLSKAIKVEIPEVNSPELGTTSTEEKMDVGLKMEDKEDEIVILQEVRHDDPSKKEVPLLTVMNESQEQEASAAKSFGSITQGTPMLRSSQVLPQQMVAPLKGAFQPHEQLGYQENVAAPEQSNEMTAEFLRILLGLAATGAPGMQVDPWESVARQLAINFYGVEPSREIIEGFKLRLASVVQPPAQQTLLQQQQQLQAAAIQQQLANAAAFSSLPGSSTLRKDLPMNAFGQSDQIKKDIVTASQMMAEERKTSSEAHLKSLAERQRLASNVGVNQRPGLLSSSESVIMKNIPEKPRAEPPKPTVKQDISILEAQHRSAFSTPSMPQNPRFAQQPSGYASLYQPSTQQQSLAKALTRVQAPIVTIEEKKPTLLHQPPSTLRVGQADISRAEISPARTRKSGLYTAVLPSPVVPPPTSQSLLPGAYSQKRTMSPSITNLQSTPSIQPRARTPFDTASLSQSAITAQPATAAQTPIQSSTQMFGIASPAQVSTMPHSTVQPVKTVEIEAPKKPVEVAPPSLTFQQIATEVNQPSESHIRPEPQAPQQESKIVNQTSTIEGKKSSTETAPAPATTSAPMAYSLLGPWAGSDASALARTTSSPGIAIPTPKEEAMPKAESAPIQAIEPLTPTDDTVEMPDAKKEAELVESKQTLPPPVQTPNLISPVQKNDLFEDISSDESEAVESDKRSTYTPVPNEETKESATGMMSLLCLNEDEALTISESIFTPPIRTPESTRSESVKAPTASTTYVQPTYEPLSDDEP